MTRASVDQSRRAGWTRRELEVRQRAIEKVGLRHDDDRSILSIGERLHAGPAENA